MELNMIATQAVSILVRQLTAGRSTDTVLAAATDRVQGLVIDRLRQSPAGHEAITELTESPEDEVRQADVHLAIRAAAESDEAFARKLVAAVRLVETITGTGEPVAAEAASGARLSGFATLLLVLAAAGLAALAASLSTLALAEPRTQPAAEPIVVTQTVRAVDPHDVTAVAGTWQSPASAQLTIAPGTCELLTDAATAAQRCQVINVSESCDSARTYYLLLAGSWLTGRLNDARQLVVQTSTGPVTYTRTA